MEKTLGVGIIGAGAIGSAIGGLVTQNGREVEYWDLDADKRTAPSLADVVGDAQVIFICAPSAANAEVAREIAAAIQSDAPRKLVVTVAKGVTKGFTTMDRLLERASDGRYDIGLLHGPMLAAEVAAHGRFSAVLAVAEARWVHGLDEFLGDSARIEYSTHPRSIALCGALKNLYALAFGVLDGFEAGHNLRAELLVKTLDEMKRVSHRLGGRASDVDGLAGLGDLVATGFSTLSFNRRAGEAMATGDLAHVKGEGINTLRELERVVDLREYPLAASLYAAAFLREKPEALLNLL